ncbi:GDP-mannose 4,6-dehydratase [Nocardioides flavus (ex Wang et al. 2016)]|uniref:GDP-mannose 4,6-dehydratase n=1 Tax=Nocardioides flavus (ex Wang et al. 2016) TaxID=2058780 RepID=A0ABQ3HFF3_9ACTN|nr:GDP-mannose 4,6-dehydratase [Nocardioides flavus (ex Wang et al. 2016)]GHE14919.1 GDP-mannose 4,6-dehydratase [Nocardioides flavus (ex Wang et al. 2016)]
MTAALVTGIGGQDGTYLAERLVAEGLEVHALVLEADGHPDHCPDEVVLHTGDLADVEATRRLVADIAPREVYNLAAISSVAQSWDEPDRTSLVNGHAAVALMESARRVGDVRLVQASSAEIFGEAHESPQDEETPLAPVNPYGAAKAYAHLAARVFRQRDLHASSLVLYNHESPRRPTRFVTRKITRGVAAIARGEADELVLGNLDARRDWGWAPDYVDAMVRAARADQPADYVVATGTAHSVRDFVAAAFAAAGIADWEPLVRQDAAFFRPADPAELVGDATRAREELGWAPTVGFEEIVRRMVAADL